MDDRYRLLDVQGEGSFGVVYRAFDFEQRRDVAVKLLKEPSSASREQIEHEALLLNQFDHRSIVGLLDYEVEADEPYLVVEYCDRGSLRGLVGKLHWRSAIRVLVQVVQGLEEIHEAGGFHCDLKPENLLVKSEVRHPFIVKIADFGLAQVPGLGPATTHAPRGTRGYIAREVLEGKPFSAAADIYSLGVVATELLTGAREALAFEEVDVPAQLRDVVLAMRNPNPAQRPPLRQIENLLGNSGQTEPSTRA